MKHLLTSLVTAGALILAPGIVRADTPVVVVTGPPTPTPVVDQVDTSSEVTTTNTPMIATGVVMFGLAYGVAAVGAGVSDTTADRRLYVPLLGPWLDLADRPACPISEVRCDETTTVKILIGVDGVVQAVGLAAIVYGILSPRRRSVTRTESAHLVPISTDRGGHGLALAGSF